MFKKVLLGTGLAVLGVATLASCGGDKTVGEVLYQAENPTTTYKWDRNHDGTLGYVMMIGDKGHNDSNARTEGAREAMKKLGKELNVTVVELASKEMKNNTGATWDATTAADTMGTWLGQFSDKLDGVISNNDGMAAGAYGNAGWIQGLPVFGFDCLPSAAKDIVDGKLSGSITQNGDAQARIVAQLLRNFANGVQKPLETGITTEDDKGNKVTACDVEYNDGERKLLVPCVGVDKTNANKYLSGKHETIKDNKGSKNLKVLVTIYNNGDNFLKEVYKPAFEFYGQALGIDFTFVEGDGSSETSVLERFTALDQYDAYVVNMVKTESGKLYTEKLTGDNKNKPLIFYNRQPFANGKVDEATMKHNDKTYYIGVNTEGSGALQGDMIYNWFKANK